MLARSVRQRAARPVPASSCRARLPEAPSRWHKRQDGLELTWLYPAWIARTGSPAEEPNGGRDDKRDRERGDDVNVEDERRAGQRGPTNIAVTARSRRPAADPAPPAIALSAAMPVMVSVSTVVVRSGTASLRAVAFWIPIEMPRSTINTYRYPPSTGSPLAAAATTDAPSRSVWNDGRRREQVSAVMSERGSGFAAYECAAHERPRARRAMPRWRTQAPLRSRTPGTPHCRSCSRRTRDRG